MERIKLDIVRAEQAHIDMLKGRLREADIKEIKAVGGTNPDAELQRSFDRSRFTWAASLKEVVLCFGVASVHELSNKGVPWMLSSDKIKDIKVAAVRQAKRYVDLMLQEFSFLENWVHADNKVSIKWLMNSGFRVAKKVEVHKRTKEKFYRFWRDRHVYT